MKNVLKNKKGITLISLVVTIVVLIILATISVTLVLGENGILTQAKKARDSQANAIVKENQDMDRLLAQYNSELGIAKNPYEPDDWEYAWVYDDGAWGEMLTRGDKIEGGIAAKFYKTGKKVDPPANFMGDLLEGDEYHLIIELIEGNGKMGTLRNVDESGNITNSYAWQLQFMDFMNGNIQNPIISYVTELVVCDGITNISDYCIEASFSLTKVVIGNTVTSIECGAFSACTSLASITIPNSVTNIEYGAFTMCTSLTNVTIPNSVTSIGDYAFAECISLSNITISGSVASIGNNAFMNCNNLITVTIQKGVTSIGEMAFYDCDNLTNVTIQEGLITIGNNAFQDCESLTSVTLGNGVTSIGEAAFGGCSSLTSITIPEGVTSIGDSAFEYCESLASVTIGNSVTTIGNNAFWTCKSLAKVKFLTTDATKITLGENVLTWIQQDSKIYVLSEEMKTKLEGTYNTSRTTVEVVSAERMEEL